MSMFDAIRPSRRYAHPLAWSRLMHDAIERARRELASIGRWMSTRGLLPATSGNLSCRVSATHVAITASGCDKGDLSPEDVLVVGIDAGIDDPAAPRMSAETPLHLQLYRDRPATGAVLHGHSIASTLVSATRLGQGRLVLAGYELLKAFRGVTTHEASVEVPIFANSQDMAALAATVSERLARAPAAVCYLLAGHGAYAWGESVGEARRHLEALEFLLTCQLKEVR
jgi:methylthioribulose-1-phosphate dehydratase